MRARYGRGPWQLFKWLIDPFALTGVYLAFVVLVLDRPGGAPGLSVACAVVPFQLVIATVITALDSTQARQTIIANMAFPRSYIPAAAAFTESVAFAASSLLLALMMAVYAVPPTAAFVWLPLVVLSNLAFATAVAYPAALFALWLPDLRTFAISLVRTAFFLAPGVIPLSQIGGTTNDLIKLNPLTGLFESYRAVLVEGTAPQAWMLLGPLAFAALAAAVFIPLYRREGPHLAKVIG
jgi:ABC-type polysaccharide/polyol phosphate export permease